MTGYLWRILSGGRRTLSEKPPIYEKPQIREGSSLESPSPRVKRFLEQSPEETRRGIEFLRTKEANMRRLAERASELRRLYPNQFVAVAGDDVYHSSSPEELRAILVEAGISRGAAITYASPTGELNYL